MIDLDQMLGPQAPPREERMTAISFREGEALRPNLTE
jgi:hypothetical protein